MTHDEYNLLTDNWDDSYGAAYNQVYKFCKEFGWLRGFDRNNKPVLTSKGEQAVKEYQISFAHKKSEAH